MISANVERGEGVLETSTTLVRKMTATLQKLEVPPTPDSTTPGEDEEVDDLELAAELADDLLSTPIDADPESGVAEEVRQTITVPLALQADGEVLELPVRLTVAGIEKEYLLTIALREAGAVPSPPLRGAAYVR